MKEVDEYIRKAPYFEIFVECLILFRFIHCWYEQYGCIWGIFFETAISERYKRAESISLRSS